MSATTYGWLILAFPLAGLLVISFGWRVLPGRSPGWIGSGAIGLSFLATIGAVVELQDRPEDARQVVTAPTRTPRPATSTPTWRSWWTRCRCSCASWSAASRS